MCETDVMRLHVRHRWISLLGLLAMLSALAAGPAAAFAAAAMHTTAMAMSDAAMAQTGSHAGMSHAGTAHKSVPCKSCPHCPKPCADHASCILKCMQNSSLAPPVNGTEEGSLVRSMVWPWRSAAVSATAVPPLLRPPSI